MASWRMREREKLIQLYQDETGILEFKMEDVAAWAEKKGVEMPVPPTPREMLTKQLAKTASTTRRLDSSMDIKYRATLAMKRRIDGQLEFIWFDADGPAATMANMKRVGFQRRERMLSIGVRATADYKHWSRTHPGQDELQLELDLTEEVAWRLNSAENGDEDEKVG